MNSIKSSLAQSLEGDSRATAMEGRDRERLGGITLCSAFGGILGTVMMIIGALVAWAHLLPDQGHFGLPVLIAGSLLYLMHVLEALCRRATSKIVLDLQ